MSDQALPSRNFAPLASAALRRFNEPSRLPGIYPLQQFITQFPPATARRAGRLVEQGEREVLARLRRAHKFVLDDEFSLLIDEMSDAAPALLGRMAATARLPFSEILIEEGADPLSGSGGRQGFLMYRGEGRRIVVVRLTMSGDRERFGEAFGELLGAELQGKIQHGLLPSDWQPPPTGTIITDALGLALDLTDEFGTSTAGSPDTLLGDDYCERWRRQRAALYGLAALGQWMLVPPHDRVLTEMLALADRRPEDVAGQRLGVWVSDSCYDGLLRRIVVLLALLSTHIAGNPIVQQASTTAPRHFLRGRFLPRYEFRVVRLYRPMDAPSLLRRAFPQAKARDGRRHHQVIGAWHHRRAATNVCQMHPRSCPLADWLRVVDDDGKPVGAEQQACSVCSRKRWFIPDHPRGDKRFGEVESAYEVHRARAAAPAGNLR